MGAPPPLIATAGRGVGSEQRLCWLCFLFCVLYFPDNDSRCAYLQITTCCLLMGKEAGRTGPPSPTRFLLPLVVVAYNCLDLSSPFVLRFTTISYAKNRTESGREKKIFKKSPSSPINFVGCSRNVDAPPSTVDRRNYNRNVERGHLIIFSKINKSNRKNSAVKSGPSQ